MREIKAIDPLPNSLCNNKESLSPSSIFFYWKLFSI